LYACRQKTSEVHRNHRESSLKTEEDWNGEIGRCLLLLVKENLFENMEYNSDDDLIFVENETKHEAMDATDTAGPSHSPKLSEIVEIFDSDDDDCLMTPNNRSLSDKTGQEIALAVNNIKQMFGKDSKVRVWDVSPDHWQSLCQILEISSRQCDDFFQVRSVVIESGVIKVLLDCLSIYTHHYPEQATTEVPQEPSTSRAPKRKATPRTYKRWNRTVKDNGTGFGSGGEHSAWKPEETLKKQLGEEKHITAMLQILASYMNPQDEIPSDAIPLPFLFVNLLEQSCLVPVIRSYMRNDSMLDMTKHIPLYRSITLLIRAISTCSELVHLLMMKQDEMDEPIAELLVKIKSSTETYKSRVR
jgi:hypothetical protein